MKNIFQKIKKWYATLPDKKQYVELITALLSVPMMVTVILVNLNNIKTKNQTATTPAITTAPIQVVVENPATGSGNVAPPQNGQTTKVTTSTVAPTSAACKKDIGPIEILSPQEGEIITTNNMCITISTDNSYCPVTWSYKLDDSSWSDFNNNDICLYNLTPGKKSLQLKVKSTVVDKSITLQRNFTYQEGSGTPAPTNSAN